MFVKLYAEYRRFLAVLFIPPFIIGFIQPRLIPLSLGIGVISFTAITYFFKDLLIKKGTKVKGKIIARLDDGDTESERTPIIQYTTLDGRPMISQPSICPPGIQDLESDNVTVIYFPDVPNAFMLEEHEFGIISVLFLLLLCSGFSLILGIMIL